MLTYFTATVRSGLLSPITARGNDKFTSMEAAEKAAHQWLAKAEAKQISIGSFGPMVSRGDFPLGAGEREVTLTRILKTTKNADGLIFNVVGAGQWFGPRVAVRDKYNTILEVRGEVLSTFTMEVNIPIFIKQVVIDTVDVDDVDDPISKFFKDC